MSTLSVSCSDAAAPRLTKLGILLRETSGSCEKPPKKERMTVFRRADEFRRLTQFKIRTHFVNKMPGTVRYPGIIVSEFPLLATGGLAVATAATATVTWPVAGCVFVGGILVKYTC